MLNVPTSVKTLFQTDGVRKNFRVHFPNGEMADITNDNVVSESVKFTESLCSQSTFKFGLAEASVLEFETVGVANMYGMTIEASCEIDCSSLSAGDKSAIAAGTWDGTWDAVNEVFAVPYGTFRVESCPRNHGAMAHRQVTAYSPRLTNTNLTSEFDSKRNAFHALFNSEKYNLWYYLYAQIGCYNPAFLSNSMTRSVLYDENNMNTATVTLAGGWNNNRHMKMVLTTLSMPPSAPYWSDTDIIGVDIGGIDLKGAYDWVVENCAAYDVPDEILNPVGKFTERAGWYFSIGNQWEIVDSRLKGGIEMYDSVPALYPYFHVTATHITIPISIDLSVDGPNDTPIVTYHTECDTPPVIYKYTPNITPPTIQMTAQCTGEETVSYNGSGYKVTRTGYSFTDAIDFVGLMTGLLEIRAMFAQAKRNGAFDFLRLSNSSPIAIGPSEYSECWWDEFNVEPIGSVIVNYVDSEKKDNTASVSIGNGASVYDMTGNEVLKDITGSSLYMIKNRIQTDFKPYVGAVAFTPIDLTMQGYPWIEAGDAIQATAEDGAVVNSYALRIEMSGIQHLQMAVTASGGEIIGEV